MLQTGCCQMQSSAADLAHTRGTRDHRVDVTNPRPNPLDEATRAEVPEPP